MSDTPVLTVQSLRKSFQREGQRIVAVDDVSLTLAAGETLALAGPSGSGKSTVARLITRLIEPDSGTVTLRGEDITHLRGSALRRHRRLLQMVFQDTTASFSPRATVGGTLDDPLRIHGPMPSLLRPGRIAELLRLVGLDPSLVSRHVHELSGGQRQRVAIARALACEPAVIVLDEALSAVDASRRADLIDLLLTLQKNNGLAYLFISHDMALIRTMAHRVAIMDRGRIVETGPAIAVINNPKSETGRALLAAVPRLMTE
jgi:peptide/nickel transport system ATP-binding protein